MFSKETWEWIGRIADVAAIGGLAWAFVLLTRKEVVFLEKEDYQDLKEHLRKAKEKNKNTANGIPLFIHGRIRK